MLHTTGFRPRTATMTSAGARVDVAIGACAIGAGIHRALAAPRRVRRPSFTPLTPAKGPST
jgi:hypothetical protein